MLGRNGDFYRSRFFRGRGTPLPSGDISRCGAGPISLFTRQERQIRNINKTLYAHWYAYTGIRRAIRYEGSRRFLCVGLFLTRTEKGDPGAPICLLPPSGTGVSGTAVGTSNIAVLENKVHF